MVWTAWIQASAALAIAALSLWTLIVLKDYAADTKRIADVSSSEVERSQMPFLSVAWQEGEGKTTGGWVIANHGFGPALNIRFSIYTALGVQEWRYIANMAEGETRTSFHSDIKNAVQNAKGRRTFTIEYCSLGGRPYSTVVDRRDDGALQTQFHKPESPSSLSLKEKAR